MNISQNTAISCTLCLLSNLIETIDWHETTYANSQAITRYSIPIIKERVLNIINTTNEYADPANVFAQVSG